MLAMASARFENTQNGEADKIMRGKDVEESPERRRALAERVLPTSAFSVTVRVGCSSMPGCTSMGFCGSMSDASLKKAA